MGIDFIMKDNTNLHHVIYTSQEIHHISKTISQCNLKHPVFFSRTDPLFEYIYAHPDDHFIIIFYSELNQKDYKLIKNIKKTTLFSEIIILSNNHTLSDIKLFSQLDIFCIHPATIHPALLALDIASLKKHKRNLTSQTVPAILTEKLARIIDIDLFLTYKNKLIQYQNPNTISYNKDTVLKKEFSLDSLIKYLSTIPSYSSNKLDCPKILVIEDDKQLNSRLHNWLKRHYYACDSCFTSTKALQLIKKNVYHLVLVDIGLPDYSGDEIIKLIRQHSPKSCIIMLTGFKDYELLCSCIYKGAQDYITKPFIPSELMETIDKNLKLSLIKGLPESIFTQIFKDNYFTNTSVDVGNSK